MGALACAALVDQFACHLAVCFRAGVAGGVAEDRLSGHRCVRELHGALDDGVEDLVAECVNDACQNFLGMDGARIEHGGKYARDFEVGVQAVLNLLDGVDQQCDGAQREELTNQRNNDTFGGGQCVDGQQAQGGLAVDEDDVVLDRKSTR